MIVDDLKDITEYIIYDIQNKSQIILKSGKYVISKPIKLSNNIEIIGENMENTIIYINNDLNYHLFSNIDHLNGNHDITIKNLTIYGNSKNIFSNVDHLKSSLCDFFYFRKCTDICIENIKGIDCKQTMMHFSLSNNININNLDLKDMYWSGISTTHSNEIIINNVKIDNSGLDKHSAIHIDGGKNITIQDCYINKSKGNGIYLDSHWSELYNLSLDNIKVYNCDKGISIAGYNEKLIKNTKLTNIYVENCNYGLFSSNVESIIIDKADIYNNKISLDLQGKFQSKYCYFKNIKFKEQESMVNKNCIVYINGKIFDENVLKKTDKTLNIGYMKCDTLTDCLNLFCKNCKERDVLYYKKNDNKYYCDNCNFKLY